MREATYDQMTRQASQAAGSRLVSLRRVRRFRNRQHWSQNADECYGLARRIVPPMGILQLLDDLPDAATRSPGRLWSVLARSLGEQGAGGRTALAWRWALTGACPSPVTLSVPAGGPPGRRVLLAEAAAPAELARACTDPGGQVTQAQFVLQWLAGEINALPLWAVGPDGDHVESAAYGPSRAEIDEVYFWGLRAQERNPWRDRSAPAAERLAFGWACGVMDLMAWACGEASKGPLSGLRVSGRPTLREVSLDACRGMTGVTTARTQGDLMLARRREALMETFLWLAGWNRRPPVDEQGQATSEDLHLPPAPVARTQPSGAAD